MPQKAKKRELVWQELKSSTTEGGGIFKLEWSVYRTKVSGGWLILVIHNTSGLTFYPDPEHKWDGTSLP